ncbi:MULTISPECIES: calcium/sodium antiporter [unclassified Oceanispirochaeta]|uniref:calcium/sodium antiporter n=1 Tax=unclassified Oceanispirochaeta TaxID=2635722 RepID=UPI001314EC22|nr:MULTISPECIES: calcium/sodium antiporter [unclassified Oceanispirochaeta]MBF9015401.1 calcium/sodium antiporter [Oceanispirochaeta sp. M2]NPD71860.1 calcium/sodium antiporter [Oceanispirochaeta sp. M1]
MTLFLWLLALTGGLLILSLSSDWFVDAAEKVGIYFRLPGFIIGVVIIGFGTSLPELASSIVSVLQGRSEIVISNAIGSNITNIFLVLGVSALFADSYTIQHDIFKTDLPFLMGSAIMIGLMTYDQNFTIAEGIICLVALALYLYRSITHGQISEQIKEEEAEEQNKPSVMTWLVLIISPVLITLGADLTVKSVVAVSEILKIGTEIIAVTVVSLGTSLPEVMVSIQAARKGKGDMAVGNVIGSNIFNTFAVMGVSAFFGTLKISSSYPVKTLPIFLGATVMAYFIVQDKKVFRFEGILLLLFYVFFLGSSYGIF